MPVLARDAGVSTATGYRYLHEGIDVPAAQAPELHQVLQAGRAAGWSHVTLDGTLIATGRCRMMKNPDTGHDPWYSGKHKGHGGNAQVVCDPTGFPVAVSDVQPGSAHNLAAARATGFLGTLHAVAALLRLPTLADDLGGRRHRPAARRAADQVRTRPPGRRADLRQYARSAVVVELQRDVEVGPAQQLLHRLQVVALLAADPQLVPLDLRLDTLRALVADELGDLLGDVGLDALLDPRGDPVGLARGLRFAGVEDLQRDVPLDQLLLEDIEGGGDPLLGVGLQRDAVLAGPRDGGVRAPEVEALRQLLAGLVEGVVDLLAVDLAHDVEGRVGHVVPLPLRRPGSRGFPGTPSAVLVGCSGTTARRVARVANGSGL